MTTKPQGLDHSGAHGAEPTGSVVIFTDITEEALEPLANAAKAQVMTEAMGWLCRIGVKVLLGHGMSLKSVLGWGFSRV